MRVLVEALPLREEESFLFTVLAATGEVLHSFTVFFLFLIIQSIQNSLVDLLELLRINYILDLLCVNGVVPLAPRVRHRLQVNLSIRENADDALGVIVVGPTHDLGACPVHVASAADA